MLIGYDGLCKLREKWLKMSKSEMSALTFNDIKDAFPYTKVIWNRDVIFDYYLDSDIGTKVSYIETHTGPSGVKYIEENYGNKKIYSLYATVVGFGCLDLYIEGE